MPKALLDWPACRGLEADCSPPSLIRPLSTLSPRCSAPLFVTERASSQFVVAGGANFKGTGGGDKPTTARPARPRARPLARPVDEQGQDCPVCKKPEPLDDFLLCHCCSKGSHARCMGLTMPADDEVWWCATCARGQGTEEQGLVMPAAGAPPEGSRPPVVNAQPPPSERVEQQPVSYEWCLQEYDTAFTKAGIQLASRKTHGGRHYAGNRCQVKGCVQGWEDGAGGRRGAAPAAERPCARAAELAAGQAGVGVPLAAGRAAWWGPTLQSGHARVPPCWQLGRRAWGSPWLLGGRHGGALR